MLMMPFLNVNKSLRIFYNAFLKPYFLFLPPLKKW